MAPVTALYDACVLYPAGLRSLLIYLATAGLVRARWTDRIHDEWITNLLAARPDLTADRLAQVRRLMDAAVLDCLVTGYDDLIDSLVLPDPDDRHVLAAAIRGGAGVIVTANLADFPAVVLAPHGVEALHPDAFVSRLIELDPETACEAARQDRTRMKKPARTADEYLDALTGYGLVRTAAALAGFKDRL
jgi:hypothetical protein